MKLFFKVSTIILILMSMSITAIAYAKSSNLITKYKNEIESIEYSEKAAVVTDRIEQLMNEGYSEDDAFRITLAEKAIGESVVKEMLKKGNTWDEIFRVCSEAKSFAKKALTSQEIVDLNAQGYCFENIFRAQDLYMTTRGKELPEILKDVQAKYPQYNKYFEEKMQKLLGIGLDVNEAKQELNSGDIRIKSINDTEQKKVAKNKYDNETNFSKQNESIDAMGNKAGVDKNVIEMKQKSYDEYLKKNNN